ncbi:MAG: hypothetical protein ACYDER_16285 [Ktedonobacteraceae bacterium]
MPDFSLPDVSVPELQMADLMMPDFDMPDASLPDPPLPSLLQPVIPPALDVLASSANPDLDATHPASGFPLAMPETPEMSGMPGIPDVAYDPTQDMPGTLDSSASSLVVHSPDNQQLPDSLAYDMLNSTADLTTRERHLGMLLLGLEGKTPVEAGEGTGQ